MPKESRRATSAVSPNVKIELDRERTLRYDLSALCAFEETTGESFDVAFQSLMERPSFRTLRALLWAGLLHEEPDLTIEAAGRLVEPGSFRRVGQAVGEAVAKVLASGDEAKEADRPLPPSPARPTG